MLHLTSLGNMWTFGNYQLLPCIIVFCILILSSLIRSYTLPECKGCAFSVTWCITRAKWMSKFAFGMMGGLTEGEACKQHVIQLSNRVSNLVGCILFTRFPLNNFFLMCLLQRMNHEPSKKQQLKQYIHRVHK